MEDRQEEGSEQEQRMRILLKAHSPSTRRTEEVGSHQPRLGTMSQKTKTKHPQRQNPEETNPHLDLKQRKGKLWNVICTEWGSVKLDTQCVYISEDCPQIQRRSIKNSQCLLERKNCDLTGGLTVKARSSWNLLCSPGWHRSSPRVASAEQRHTWLTK